MADEEERNRMIAEFTGVTGTDPERAQFYLESSRWELHIALSSFFDSQGDEPSPPRPQAAQDEHTPAASTRTTRSSGGSRFATIGSMKATEDSDSSEGEGQAFYAGGSDSSGQQILGPPRKKQTASDITKELFEEAKKHGAEEVEASETPVQRAPAFVGAGYRLGDTEGGTSHPVQLQRGPAEVNTQPMTVVLKFWSNGFSVDDGPLRDFDDPANEEFLGAVKRGEIPRELLRLSRGGEVHVDMEDHRNEEYVKPKAVLKAFSGEGRKLGSPTPAVKFSDNKPPAASVKSAPASSSSGPAAAFKIDQSQPTTSIQIRLGDGTRMVSKFNHTHTVSDIRNFICAARREMSERNFVLMTTFPNKELSDESQSIADANLLNAVIVQRFK